MRVRDALRILRAVNDDFELPGDVDDGLENPEADAFDGDPDDDDAEGDEDGSDDDDEDDRGAGYCPLCGDCHRHADDEAYCGSAEYATDARDFDGRSHAGATMSKNTARSGPQVGFGFQLPVTYR